MPIMQMDCDPGLSKCRNDGPDLSLVRVTERGLNASASDTASQGRAERGEPIFCLAFGNALRELTANAHFFC